jgi:hypothetical protein
MDILGERLGREEERTHGVVIRRQSRQPFTPADQSVTRVIPLHDAG